MDKDERVTCTDCVNWEFLKKKQEDYFGCRTDCINKKDESKNCPCNSCSCYDPTSTRRFETRPMFVPKDI